jgi:hypothetical protein
MAGDSSETKGDVDGRLMVPGIPPLLGEKLQKTQHIHSYGIKNNKATSNNNRVYYTIYIYIYIYIYNNVESS